MEVEEFLSSSSPFKPELLAFLLPCHSMRLLDQVVASGGRHDLNVLHAVEQGTFPNGRPIAPQLVGVDGFGELVCAEEVHEKEFGGLSVTVPLKEYVQHGSIFVHRPPQPMLHPADLDTDLVQMPPGTATRFPVAEVFGQERRELDVPLPQRLVTDVNAALEEQFLNVTLAQGEAVIQPQGMADDAQGKTVAVEVIRKFGDSVPPDWAAHCCDAAERYPMGRAGSTDPCTCQANQSRPTPSARS